MSISASKLNFDFYESGDELPRYQQTLIPGIQYIFMPHGLEIRLCSMDHQTPPITEL